MDKKILIKTNELSVPVIFLLTLVFLSCASVSPPQRRIPEDYSGIVHAGGSRTPEEFRLMKSLGMNWTLHTFNWSRIESEPGKWDFRYYDEIVDMADRAGIKTLGVLAYDNGNVQRNQTVSRYIPSHEIPLFLEYVRKTVTHFRGRVDAWCIWNEPNTPRFWKGTDAEFYELTKLAADTVRETDSEVILLGGAVNRGVFGLPKKFINGLFKSASMNRMDGVAFHPYELNPARTARLYDNFQKMVKPWGFDNKIWITEVGYPTGGLYPTKVSEKKFSHYVIKTFTLLAIRDTRVILWYQLFDSVNRNPSNSENFFGLVRSAEDYQSKGSEAFRLCATYISGTFLNAQDLRRENLPSSLNAYYFYGEETSALVLWNDNPAPVKIRTSLPGTVHAMHNINTGAKADIQANADIRVGSEPVFITWQVSDARTVVLKRR
ncbi:MAG: beta-galactosidase [Treponema sp.]|nr:beta-galactosidase [Treponema sp.]